MIATISKAIAKKREDGEKGFTLIELLVVILIIGVLAAIAIPVFLNQREAAWEAQVNSDIANAVLAAEQFSVDHNGSYAALDLAGLEDSGYNDTPSVVLTVAGVTATEYQFVVTHTDFTGHTWTYTHSTGVTVRT